MLPADKLGMALTKPKLAMKDNTKMLDSRPNSSFPKSGTTICYNPISAPTKAFTNISSRNWSIFGLKPSLVGMGLLLFSLSL